MWLRRHPLFLLTIALALPLGVAFLNYDFYGDNDPFRLNQISMADDEDLLSFLRKNPRIFVAAHETVQSACINLFETQSFSYIINPVTTNQKSPVLRC